MSKLWMITNIIYSHHKENQIKLEVPISSERITIFYKSISL